MMGPCGGVRWGPQGGVSPDMIHRLRRRTRSASHDSDVCTGRGGVGRGGGGGRGLAESDLAGGGQQGGSRGRLLF